MKILFITISWPELGTRNLYTDLMHKFKDEGHDIQVVANRPKRRKLPTSFELDEGIKVLRIKTGNVSKTNPIEKCISLLKLGSEFKKGVEEYLNESEFDLIIFNTPPITLSGFLEYLKDKYQAPLYLLLKDIWPYGFADNGLIKKDGWIFNYFKKHERKLYKLADKIGCMSPKGVEFIQSKYPEIDDDKFEVCYNSVRIDYVDQIEVDYVDMRSKFNIPKDATVFIFSGNIGLGHGVEYLMENILQLKNYHKAFFLIGGAGTYFDKIKQQFEEEKPSNAYLYSYLPKDEYESLVATCDVGIILLSSNYTYPQFPSRLLSYLENKMAVLCAVNQETDIGEIVEINGAGINTIHGRNEEFINAVKTLCEKPVIAKQMGEKGYKLLKNKFSVNDSYRVIMNNFKNVE